MIKGPDGVRELTEEEWALVNPNEYWRSVCRVSKMKAELALDEWGLLDQVETFLNGTTNKKLKIAYHATTEIPRNSQLVELMASELGLTEDQLDELFRLAETIEV